MPTPAPDAPAGVKTGGKRQEAARARRLAFAAAACRLGTAAAAYREIYPASREWKPASVSREAGRLMRDPVVKDEIDRINADARLDAIASRQEIASLLAEIMRGNVKQTTIARVRKADGSQDAVPVECEPPISQRIRAAKELERMLPAVLPDAPAEKGAPADEATSTLQDRLADLRRQRQKRATES